MMMRCFALPNLGLFLVFCALWLTPLLAKEYIASEIPLPSVRVLDLDPTPCDVDCLRALYAQNLIFSFVARLGDNTRIDLDSDDNATLKANYTEAHLSIRGVINKNVLINKSNLRVAILIPDNIASRYLRGIINTVLSYLATRESSFTLEVIKSNNESVASLNNAYEKIRALGYSCVIALLTSNGVSNLTKGTSISLPTYIPSINIKMLGANTTLPANLYLGGIDYEEQMEMLLRLASGRRLVVYNDNSPVGRYLGNIIYKRDKNISIMEEVSSKDASTFLNRVRKQRHMIGNSVVFLNTPFVKSSLILSQLGYISERPAAILSTQINYTPSLLLLVQPRDRRALYVASLIGKIDPIFLEYAALIGADISYSWINYSTAIGINKFYLMLNAHKKSLFAERFLNNQVRYHNRLYRAMGHSFEQVRSLDR